MTAVTPAEPAAQHYRSKTLATWLAVLLGPLGMHRFYLHGFKDWIGWFYPLPTMAGLLGAQQLREVGQDSPLVWVLLPVLGLVISASMLSAIVYGLTPDARWDERHNPGQAGASTGWGPVLGVIVALMVGSAVLLGSVAYSGQKFFEWQLASQPVAR